MGITQPILDVSKALTQMNLYTAQTSFSGGNSIPDRRRKRRYPLVLELQWKVLKADSVAATGTGTTLDLSSSGILFHCDKPLPQGYRIMMSISWPVALDGFPALQLAVSGVILRTTKNGSAAVRILNHEFRTMARESGESHRERRRLSLLPVRLNSRL
jgi:hypothetical protein